jgi:phosphoglycerate dehydrogenase-like enzyme
MGNTGRRVAEIAVRGFEMKAVYFDRFERPDAEKELGARRLSLEETLAASDFVSVHVNLSPETRGLIGAKAFSLMKKGAVLINLSRGPVVDEAAPSRRARSGHLGGAGLRLRGGAAGRDHPLFQLPNVVLTPHIGGASAESKRGCSMVALDIVRVLRGEQPVHGVA